MEYLFDAKIFEADIRKYLDMGYTPMVAIVLASINFPPLWEAIVRALNKGG